MAARPRVVVIGLGDAGLATAVHLVSRCGDGVEVVGVSPQPCHYSAQEVGGRLSQPALWKTVYLLPFECYKMLDRVRIIQALVQRVDTAERTVTLQLPDGSERAEQYDALLISSGCTNGFWRRPAKIQSRADIEATLNAEQALVAAARVIAVVGGGPSGVSAAYNLAQRHGSTKAVHCFVSGSQVLPGYHWRTRARVEARLEACGVVVHHGHRASLARGAAPPDRLCAGPLSWSSGQPDFEADLVVWAVGAVRPNTAFLPESMLTPDGFVAVDDCLRVRGHEGAIFAVGDVAATDEARSSARNNGWALVSNNILACLGDRPRAMRRYHPPTYRWGSILGPWDGLGYEVFFQNGWLVWLPLWVWNMLWPLVQRFLWAGMRNTVDWTRAERSAWGPPGSDDLTR